MDELLHGDARCPAFSSAEQAVAQVATAMSNFDPEGSMDDEPLAKLQHEFAPDELTELLAIMGVLAGVARMLLAAGFISRTCRAPLEAHHARAAGPSSRR